MFIDNEIKKAVLEGHKVYHFENNQMAILESVCGLVVIHSDEYHPKDVNHGST